MQEPDNELHKAVVSRLISPDDLRHRDRLVEYLRPAIAPAVLSPLVFSALGVDAVCGRGCIIVAAYQDGTPCGIVIAIVNRVHFWRWFLLRHPISGLVFAALKLQQRLRRRRRPGPPEAAVRHKSPSLDAAGLKRTWRESSATIAKTLFIGVAPESRGRGIAKQLYTRLFGALRQQGVTRIDAHIDSDNLASVRLHESSGWQVQFGEIGYIATKDLT